MMFDLLIFTATSLHFWRLFTNVLLLLQSIHFNAAHERLDAVFCVVSVLRGFAEL